MSKFSFDLFVQAFRVGKRFTFMVSNIPFTFLLIFYPPKDFCGNLIPFFASMAICAKKKMFMREN